MRAGPVTIVGGGLAGSEAAWQVAERGIPVRLFEMRPTTSTGAHVTDKLAELVCSNSLGSQLPDRASGILMNELRQLGSLLLDVAEKNALPAGGALAVDRLQFSIDVTNALSDHPLVEILREEVLDLPAPPAIVASGPLTTSGLTGALMSLTGSQQLFFYDAISPIVEADSIDLEIAFRGSRYERGQLADGDYINCPMDEQQYQAFVEALLTARRIPLRSFEHAVKSGVRAGLHAYFEGCLPVEIIAERGRKSLAFGPMRPVGLRDPRTGRRPHAVVQLRQDDLAGGLYNMVGFQTNLRYPEQRRVFRMIPGLEDARFSRYGQMHRNTFLNSPMVLNPTLQLKGMEGLFLAGQICGVEGYLGNIATGLLAGLNAGSIALGRATVELPPTTMLGSLLHYVTHAEPTRFQPMKANLGILPQLPSPRPRKRRDRARAHAERADRDLREWMLGQADWLRVAK